jgi:hypothetical protein
MHWDDIDRVVAALKDRTVTPSLVLKKLSAYRQQNSLAAALREVGRVQRTLFTLRWLSDPALRRLITAELNKGEARNSLARAVAFHRHGRWHKISKSVLNPAPDVLSVQVGDAFNTGRLSAEPNRNLFSLSAPARKRSDTVGEVLRP